MAQEHLLGFLGDQQNPKTKVLNVTHQEGQQLAGLSGYLQGDDVNRPQQASPEDRVAVKIEIKTEIETETTDEIMEDIKTEEYDIFRSKIDTAQGGYSCEVDDVSRQEDIFQELKNFKRNSADKNRKCRKGSCPNLRSQNMPSIKQQGLRESSSEQTGPRREGLNQQTSITPVLIDQCINVSCLFQESICGTVVNQQSKTMSEIKHQFPESSAPNQESLKESGQNGSGLNQQDLKRHSLDQQEVALNGKSSDSEHPSSYQDDRNGSGLNQQDLQRPRLHQQEVAPNGKNSDSEHPSSDQEDRNGSGPNQLEPTETCSDQQEAALNQKSSEQSCSYQDGPNRSELNQEDKELTFINGQEAAQHKSSEGPCSNQESQNGSGLNRHDSKESCPNQKGTDSNQEGSKVPCHDQQGQIGSQNNKQGTKGSRRRKVKKRKKNKHCKAQFSEQQRSNGHGSFRQNNAWPEFNKRPKSWCGMQGSGWFGPSQQAPIRQNLYQQYPIGPGHNQQIRGYHVNQQVTNWQPFSNQQRARFPGMNMHGGMKPFHYQQSSNWYGQDSNWHSHNHQGPWGRGSNQPGFNRHFHYDQIPWQHDNYQQGPGWSCQFQQSPFRRGAYPFYNNCWRNRNYDQQYPYYNQCNQYPRRFDQQYFIPY